MKNTVRFSVIVVLLFVLFSCSSDYNNSSGNPNYDVTYKASLDGASEVPATPSLNKGSATLVYNTSTKKFTINVQFTGFTAISGHVHKGAVGQSGPAIFPFPPNPTSPINYTSPVLDASQAADLNANLYYVNIHSSLYPDGEIRGQLIKQMSTPYPDPNPYPDPGPY